MKMTRSFLVAVATVSLLGLPAAALATAPTAGVPAPHSSSQQAQYKTSIRYLPFLHIHAAGSRMAVTGQVTAFAQGQHGALEGVEVKLYRKLAGQTEWSYQASQNTTSGATPEFRFGVSTIHNASYEVVFAGNATFGASQRSTWLTVYRSFNGVITDGKSAATLHGNVTPYYTHKTIMLQKRSCASCDYTTVKTITTGTNGTYSFLLPAPASGRWWWRMTIPGTDSYMESFSGTFSTTQI